jgi:hypothetical protein
MTITSFILRTIEIRKLESGSNAAYEGIIVHYGVHDLWRAYRQQVDLLHLGFFVYVFHISPFEEPISIQPTEILVNIHSDTATNENSYILVGLSTRRLKINLLDLVHFGPTITVRRLKRRVQCFAIFAEKRYDDEAHLFRHIPNWSRLIET